MALNWLPNVEFNKEIRTYTTKDIETNAKAIEEARKDQVSARSALRDLQRKRAIEKATANAIDAKGELSEPKLRQALIDAGFGEDAEATANKIYKDRVAVLNENIDLRKKIAEATAMETVQPEDANRVLTGDTQVPVQSTVQNRPADLEAISKDPAAFWAAQSGQKPVATLGPQLPQTTSQPSAKPISEPSVAKGVSQFTPGYAQMGGIDFAKYNAPSQTVSPVKFELSSDPNLQAKQIAAIKQELQIDIPKGTSLENINRIVNERIDAMAASGNVMPPRSAFGGDLAKYKAKEAEVASAFGKTKNEILSKLSGQVNTGRQLGTGEKQATTSEKAQNLKQAEVEADRTTPWGKGMLQVGLKEKVSDRSPQARGALDEYGKLESMFAPGGKGQNDPAFRNTLFNLVKYTLRVKGLQASDQKLSTIESNFKPGINIDNLLEGLEPDVFKTSKNILIEAYRGNTTNLPAIKGTVKQALQEFRDIVPIENRNYNDNYFYTMPMIDETIHDQENLMKKSQTSSEPSDRSSKKFIKDKKAAATKSSGDKLPGMAK